MSEHKEFPKYMSHPNARKAQSIPIPGTEVRNAGGVIIRQDFQGTPERFPPVLVNNLDEVEYYAAQGYVDNGVSNPAHFAMMAANPPDPNYEPERYPMWVGSVLVNNEAEEREARGEPEDATEGELNGHTPARRGGRPRKVAA